MSALRVETIICALLILGSICAQHNSQAVRWHQPEQSSEDYELLANRMELTEESLRAYMFETNPVLSALRNDVRGIRKANKYLMKTLSRQRRELEDLRWATTQLKLSEVQEEERDMITQLQWTIFDLKFANERLQEDSCFRDTTCSDWTGWSHCSVTCSSGTRIRSRDCNQTGSFKSLCKPIVYDEVPCEEKACPTVEPVYEMTRCPKNYTSFDGYCLRFSGRQDTRLLSGIICNEDGGHLVTIDSNDKNEIVWEFLKKEAPQYMVDMNEDFSKREFWDFHDIDQKTNVAIDGVRGHRKTEFKDWREQKMTYFNWAVGEPRNDRSDGDYCVTFNVLTGTWYMRCCSVTFYYVCEVDGHHLP